MKYCAVMLLAVVRLGVSVPLSAQVPCETPLDERVTNPTAIAANLPDHTALTIDPATQEETPVTTFYEVSYFEQGSDTNAQPVQGPSTVPKGSWTLVSGSPDCYTTSLPASIPVPGVDLIAKIRAVGPGGPSVWSEASNTFVREDVPVDTEDPTGEFTFDMVTGQGLLDASDNVGVSSATVWMDNIGNEGVLPLAAGPPLPVTFVVDISQLSVGSHTLVGELRDEAGNSALVTHAFTIPTPLPGDGPLYPNVEQILDTVGTHATSHTVAIPIGTPSGHLLVWEMSCDSAGTQDPNPSTPAGWTDLVREVTFNPGSSAAVGLYIRYRVSDGTESSPVAFTTAVLESCASRVYRISGSMAVPEGVGDVHFPDDPVDPPSLSPTWGHGPALWLTFAAHDDARVRSAISTVPLGYTAFPILDGGGSNDSVTHAGWRLSDTASEDPDPFFPSTTRPMATATVGILGTPSAPPDTDGPAISISTPTPVALRYDVAASDPSGVQSYVVVLDGTTVQTGAAAMFQYVLDLRPLSSGTHTLEFKFVDGAGNMRTETVPVTK